MPPTSTEERSESRREPAYSRTLPGTALHGRDVRSKKPPALSFLLRMETLRRLARIVSLLALDVGGVILAIYTALALKALVRDDYAADRVWHATQEIAAFACLVTLLLFARGGLYAGRAERPGLTRIVASLTQVTAVALLFALVNGERFSGYYVFYGSLFFGVLYIATFRTLYERSTGAILRAAGYQRRAVLVGTGAHIEAVAHALEDAAHSPVNLIGFIPVSPRPDDGLRSLWSLDDLPEVL